PMEGVVGDDLRLLRESRHEQRRPQDLYLQTVHPSDGW
ncbi:MAG: hypothetical protein ACJATT_001218, partial [Myxococcota bacterium]